MGSLSIKQYRFSLSFIPAEKSLPQAVSMFEESSVLPSVKEIALGFHNPKKAGATSLDLPTSLLLLSTPQSKQLF
jgi:hypothetical protein